MDNKAKKSGLSNVQNKLFTVLIIMIFIGIISVFYFLLHNEIKDSIILNGELNAVSASERIDKYLTKGDDVIKLTGYTLDNMIRGKRSSQEMLDYIVNQTVAASNIISGNSNGIYAYINGVYLDGVGWVPDDDYVPTERPWYTLAVNGNGNVVVVDPYIDAQTGTTMITLAKTLCDGKSVVAMDISLEELQSITEAVVYESEPDIEIILDRSNQVIAHSDKMEIGKNYAEEKDTLWGAIMSALWSSDEKSFSVDYDNNQYIVYEALVKNDWLCLSVIDATSIIDRMRIPLLFTIAAALIIVTVLLVILVRSNKNGILAEKMKEMAELQTKYAYHDQMTGLLNRRAYSEKIDSYLKKMPQKLCLVMLDVNGLKTVNDTFGHEAGDELITAAAGCIRDAFPDTEDIYRLGGDEFCVILRGDTDLAEGCLNKMDDATKNFKGQYIDGFTVSFGVGRGDENSDIGTVVKEADKRMYEHKENYYASEGMDRRKRVHK